MEPSTLFFPHCLVPPALHPLLPSQITSPQGGAFIPYQPSDDMMEWEWVTTPNRWEAQGRMFEEWGRRLDAQADAFHRSQEKMARELEEYEKLQKAHHEVWKVYEEAWKAREEAWKVREEAWKAGEGERKAREEERAQEEARAKQWAQFKELVARTRARDGNLHVEKNTNARPSQDGTTQGPEATHTPPIAVKRTNNA